MDMIVWLGLGRDIKCSEWTGLKYMYRSLFTGHSLKKPLLMLNVGLFRPKTMFRPTVSQFEGSGLL